MFLPDIRDVLFLVELAFKNALFICLTLFVQEENNLAWQFPFYCSICQNEGFFSLKHLSKTKN